MRETGPVSEIEWGDVLSTSAGTVVAEAVVDGRPCVVKRFARAEYAREVENYELLGRLGVPTLEMITAGPDWIAIEDIADAGLRLATPADLDSVEIARWLAAWYDELHGRGLGVPELAALYCENDLVTPANLAEVAQRWPELGGPLERIAPRVDGWLATAAELPRTLTYNDFGWTNLAVDELTSRVLVFDYNLLGTNYRYADLRNVTSQLSQRAGAAFLAEYDRLLALRGLARDPREAEVDEPLSHLASLVLASRARDLPAWAEPSRAWLLAH